MIMSKTILQAHADKVHRVILPLDPQVRRAHYIAQNTRRAGIVAGGGEGLHFTARQLRRMRKKDKLSRPYRAPEQAWAWAEAKIDNQRIERPRHLRQNRVYSRIAEAFGLEQKLVKRDG
jgi:hypothetical protein